MLYVCYNIMCKGSVSYYVFEESSFHYVLVFGLRTNTVNTPCAAVILMFCSISKHNKKHTQ